MANPSVQPAPNVYTLLVIISIVAMLASIFVVGNRLMSPLSEGGYGLTIGMFFRPTEQQKKLVDDKWPERQDTLEPDPNSQ